MPPAIAAVAAGVAAGFAASSVVVGIAVAIGTVALQSSLKPEMPGVEESVNEAQTLTTQPLQPHRGVYGEGVVSGSIIGYGKRKMGDKEAHVVAVTLAGHQIESAELYEVNGKPKPSGTTYTIMRGDQTTANQTALQYCDGWTENHVGFGRAYAVVTIPIDPEEMPSGLQNITFKVKGKRVYDPRKDTTVGGDGPHRANDEATWEWSDNSILCAFDYQRFHGFRKLSLNKFDLAHIMEQANICDEMVSYTDSDGQQQTEKRFTCNGSWTFDQSPPKVLERIMSSCGGKPYRRGGKIYLQTASYHGMAELTLTDNDATGEIIITPHRELKDRCNLVRASLQDPKKGYQPTDAPVVKNEIYIERDGMELEDELQLNFTNSATMAQRLMKYHLERNRAGMRIQFPCKAKGLLAMAGKTVHVDLPNEGIDKEFIVTDWGFDVGSKKVSLVLEEESPALYSDSLVPSEGNLTPNTNLPDFTRPDAPESVSFVVDSVSTHRQGYVTWSHPTPRAVTEYRVLVRKDGDDIVEYPVIARSSVQLKQDINGLDAGQYSIEVYARNRYDRTSVPATISLTLNEPSPPTSLGATAGNWEITLAPTLAGIGLGTMFEFAYGTPDNIIGRGASIVIPGLTPDTEHDVYARTVNILGQSAMRHETIRTTKDTSQVDPIIETYTNRLDEVDSNFQSFVENEFTDLQQLVNDNAQEINVRFSNELFERERNDATVLRSIIDAAASRNELRRRIERGEELIGAVLDVDPVTGTITNRAFEYTDNRFSEAQLRLDGVAGEINATVERLTFNEQRVTQLGAEINLLPGVIDQRATAIVADSIAALEPAHAFNFFDSAQGWTAVTGTITPGVNRVLLEIGDITNSELAYSGQEYPVIRMSVRRTAGENWLGNIVVTFTDDSTESYPGIIEPIEVLDTDVIRIVDFTALNSYHGDIKALRITLGQDNTDTFELKSLSIGKPDAALQDLTNIQAQVVTASSRIDALSGEVADKVDVETWTQEGVTRTNVESVLNGIEAYATMKVTYQAIDENGLIEKANDAALFIDGYEGTFTSYVASLDQRLNEDGEAISQQFTTVENKLDAQDGRIRSQALSTSSTREGLDSNILEDLQSAVDFGLYRFNQLDKDVRFSLAIEELQAITGPSGSLARSIQNLESITQQDGKAIEAQAQRLALAETTIDGNARALQVLGARVGDQEEFARAQLELNASYNETLEAYEAYAFLGVEQVQNGRAVLTGVTFGGSQNAISFRGDVFQWEDTQGNMLLHYDTDEGVAYLRARLVLGDGFTVTTEDDIRGLDGEQGPPGPQGPEGPVGPQGVPGEPGADGQVYYTWIRYADDINGNGISNQPDGKFYMGLAYNKTSPTESNDPSDYTWSRFRGEDGTDGVQGPPGEDGQTTYTWIAYSDSADGSGMYQVPNSNTKYIGIATNKTTATESNDPSDYTWSRFRGEDGAQGPQGPQGPAGNDGATGPGFFGARYDTINWSQGYSRFHALTGRNPIPGDIFVQTLTDGSDSSARQRNPENNGWDQVALQINGSMVATGTIAGDRFIAGTELNSPVIKSGRVELVGSNYMSIQTATPFGPNNLLEWKGPRNSYTYDETNKLVKFDGLTKANALQYFSDAGDSYFGGSITAGTLKNAVQSTQLGNTDVTVGPFGSNGGLIEIKCSISAARSTGLVSGNCPYPAPSAPTGTMRLYRETAGGEILVATQNVSGSYNCLDEGPEHIENWQLSGSFTYTDNLQTASNRTYRLEVEHNLPIYPNGSQSLSLITEEA
ncbi:phage tail protein [Idiomarina aquatica]|uniref:Fibronectin type-III domain-containing protein n=1 Tax=Idiomarina aquatica TaxID=1327752 RepID=A0AA94EGC4_9GAMM|nr:phage tail protein [Idiomarina aquatica]RUO44981.1 hypothetical protein CWE23_02835 [Idiomarina aquatica]